MSSNGYEVIFEEIVIPAVEKAITQRRWNGMYEDIRQEAYLRLWLLISFKKRLPENILNYAVKTAVNAGVSTIRRKAKIKKT